MFVNHEEMVAKLRKPGADLLRDLTPEGADAWHMASCIVGEAAELFIGVNRFDRPNLIEEMGDIEFYMAGLRQVFGIDRAMVIANLSKEEPMLNGWLAAQNLAIASGELFDVVKKKAIYAKEVSADQVMHAMVPVEAQLCALGKVFDFKREDVIQANLDKLNKRYAAGSFSNSQAQARADKNEPTAADLAELVRIYNEEGKRPPLPPGYSMLYNAQQRKWELRPRAKEVVKA